MFANWGLERTKQVAKFGETRVWKWRSFVQNNNFWHSWNFFDYRNPKIRKKVEHWFKRSSMNEILQRENLMEGFKPAVLRKLKIRIDQSQKWKHFFRTLAKIRKLAQDTDFKIFQLNNPPQGSFNWIKIRWRKTSQRIFSIIKFKIETSHINSKFCCFPIISNRT